MAYFWLKDMPLKHKLVNNFGTNRDILINFFVVDHHAYGLWYEMK
jgi:hypothetical protein